MENCVRCKNFCKAAKLCVKPTKARAETTGEIIDKPSENSCSAFAFDRYKIKGNQNDIFGK